jgi:hypothetical protein
MAQEEKNEVCLDINEIHTFTTGEIVYNKDNCPDDILKEIGGKINPHVSSFSVTTNADGKHEFHGIGYFIDRDFLDIDPDLIIRSFCQSLYDSKYMKDGYLYGVKSDPDNPAVIKQFFQYTDVPGHPEQLRIKCSKFKELPLKGLIMPNKK